MALSKSSRYYETVDNSSTYIALPKERQETRYRSYITKEGDTFDILAAKVLSDPRMYWRVADLNPQLPFPDRIPAGTEIRLPL